MSQQRNNYKAIADAIRAKTGSSDDMTPLEMPSEIESIPTGGGDADPVPEYLGASLRDYSIENTSEPSGESSRFKAWQIYQIKSNAPDSVVIDSYYKDANDNVYPVAEVRIPWGSGDKRTGSTRELICPKTMGIFYFSVPTTSSDLESWDRLTNIGVDEDNPYFYSCGGCLLQKSGNTGILVYGSETGDLDTVASISPYGFAGVGKIGPYAFYGSKSLTSITLPIDNTVGHLFEVKKYAFSHCPNVTSITLQPDSKIGKISLGDYAFSDCGDLEVGINSNRNIYSLGEKVFSGTYAPSISCHIYDESSTGNNLPYLDRGFVECFDLTKVSSLDLDYLSVKPSLISSGDYESSISFEGVPLAALTKYQGAYYASIGRSDYDILVSADFYPNEVTKVDYSNSFTRKALEYTTDFPIHSDCKYIADKAFYKCSTLETLQTNFFKNIQFIGQEAFSLCTSLKGTDSNGVLDFAQTGNSTLCLIATKAFYTYLSYLNPPLVEITGVKAKYTAYKAFSGQEGLKRISGDFGTLGYYQDSYGRNMDTFQGCGSVESFNIRVNKDSPINTGSYNGTSFISSSKGGTVTIKMGIQDNDQLDSKMNDSGVSDTKTQLNCFSQKAFVGLAYKKANLWITSNLCYLHQLVASKHQISTIEVSPDNPLFSAENNVLYNKDKTQAFFAALEAPSTITFPASLKIFGTRASVPVYDTSIPIKQQSSYAYCDLYDSVTDGDDHITTLNFPSTIEHIDLSELNPWDGCIGDGLETINVSYSANNTYVTSDDGKALFLNTSPDLTLEWANAEDAASFPSFTVNGSAVTTFQVNNPSAVFRGFGYITLDTGDAYDYSILETFGTGNDPNLGVEEIYLNDSVYDMSWQATSGLRSFYASTYRYPGTVDEYKQSCYYELDPLYDKTITCSDRDYNKKEEEGSSSNNNGDLSY